MWIFYLWSIFGRVFFFPQTLRDHEHVVTSPFLSNYKYILQQKIRVMGIKGFKIGTAQFSILSGFKVIWHQIIILELYAVVFGLPLLLLLLSFGFDESYQI